MSYTKINITFLVILFSYLLTFLLYPELDVLVTKKMVGDLYYGGFCTKLTGPIKKSITIFIFIVGILKFILFGITYYFKRFLPLNFVTQLNSYYLRSGLFLMFNLLIVCGLMVEGLKHLFSRLRPDLNNFSSYESILSIGSSCSHNCSFPSGDAALGFMIFPLLLSITRKYNFALIVGLISGILFSYCRISVGRHYLSDVMFSGMLIYYWTLMSYNFFKLKSERS